MRQLKISKQVTNRETASLDKYLQEIGKVELITAEEEVELAQRIKQGDRAALEKLTKANLRFVVSVANPITDAAKNIAIANPAIFFIIFVLLYFIGLRLFFLVLLFIL